jgi:hypothetical protein
MNIHIIYKNSIQRINWRLNIFFEFILYAKSVVKSQKCNIIFTNYNKITKQLLKKAINTRKRSIQQM